MYEKEGVIISLILLFAIAILSGVLLYIKT